MKNKAEAAEDLFYRLCQNIPDVLRVKTRNQHQQVSDGVGRFRPGAVIQSLKPEQRDLLQHLTSDRTWHRVAGSR